MGQSRSFKICVVPTARVARCTYTAQQPLYGLWNTFLFSSQIALYCYYRFCAISGTEKTLAKRWMASVLPRRDAPRHRTLPTPSTRCRGERNLPECPRGCGAAGCGSPPSLPPAGRGAQPPPRPGHRWVNPLLPSLMSAGHNITAMTQGVFAVRRMSHLF